MSQIKRYIPLNAGESTVLPDANTLLPRDEVYEPLAKMITDAVKKADAAKGKSLNELREHNAISIDGARGTGKTAVLVNLKSYLNDSDVLKAVHIFDPVDPTLLENGESLFLHIIVAAVLHDKDVKDSQRKVPNKARSLNQTLEKLAQSMESVETQKERHGMDKIRAMYSNKQLAECVQDFFREVVELLGKKLLILPIDDVDTALDRAFENLEIVRRYLTTPYVLPIVSGDRSLYDEVTWRDFHGRLTEDSKYLSDTVAYKTAKELAKEYQRKILPFPRRLTMPTVDKYWQQSNIYLCDGQQAEVMPLRNFIAWLEIFLAGPVNGLGDSQLPLPIPSMRALTQLLNQCQYLIPTLPESIKRAVSAVQVKRAWQMPDVPESAIKAFEEQYQEQYKAKKRDYNPAYAQFAAGMKVQSISQYDDWRNVDRQQWTSSLRSHFEFETEAGPAYLVLLTREYWQQWRNTPAEQRTGSVFDTALFRPRWHNQKEYQLFDKRHDLSGWTEQLTGKMPPAWLKGLNSIQTMLTYPPAERGWDGSRVTPLLKSLDEIRPAEDWPEDWQEKVGLLLTLISDRYYFDSSKRRAVLNIGRIFELIITSLIVDIELTDIERIMRGSAFFSAKQQAPQTVLSGVDEVSLVEEGQFEFDYEASLHGYDLSKLQQQIAEWREKNMLSTFDISPWLIYQVFCKTFDMLADITYTEKDLPFFGVALNRAGLVFYATWSAFGHFEKGPLFGLPRLVTGTSLRSARNFESNDHFKMNIGHLAPYKQQLTELSDIATDKSDATNDRRLFGIKTRTITNALAYHPLLVLIDEVASFNSPKDDSHALKNEKGISADQWLSEKLNITRKQAKDTASVGDALSTRDLTECKQLWNEMSSKFPRESEAKTALRTALKSILPEQF
ncbi:hypothetical protein VI06_04965 [Aquitalea magnusonii]|nr:hypothetical protein VI06_04965 [Aquitalea magnusonii]